MSLEAAFHSGMTPNPAQTLETEPGAPYEIPWLVGSFIAEPSKRPLRYDAGEIK